MLISRRFLFRRLKMLSFLDELETDDSEAKSLYVPSGLLLSELEGLLQIVLGVQKIPPGLAELAAGSETGAIVFWGSSRGCLVLPPFPVTEKYLTDGYDVEPLRALLQRDFMLALILVRLGAYAVGVCRGEMLIASKVGTGLVHARHKKGGSSQHRFARHREKQIEQFLDRVCGHVQERLEPYAQALDYVVYGGARVTIRSFRKRCSFLCQFDNRALPPLLDIPDPRKAVLEAAVGRVWASSLIEWYDSGVLP